MEPRYKQSDDITRCDPVVYMIFQYNVEIEPFDLTEDGGNVEAKDEAQTEEEARALKFQLWLTMWLKL